MTRPRTLAPPSSALAQLIDRMSDREGISLNQLADLIFVDRSFLSRLRTGDRMPSIHVVLQMAANWPLTETERVELCTHFQVLPPGYHMVPNGEWEVAARAS